MVPVDALAGVPEAVDLRQAATLPVSGSTALQGLRAGGLRGGQLVVVGHLAVQLAVAEGATAAGASPSSPPRRTPTIWARS